MTSFFAYPLVSFPRIIILVIQTHVLLAKPERGIAMYRNKTGTDAMAACQKRRIKSYLDRDQGGRGIRIGNSFCFTSPLYRRQERGRKEEREKRRREKSNTNTDQSDHRNIPHQDQTRKGPYFGCNET